MYLKNKTLFISGATDGIGKYAALRAAEAGARLLLHGRKQERIETLSQFIRQHVPEAKFECFIADFSKLSEVKAMAETLLAKKPEIDIVINNAAEMTEDRKLTEDGFEHLFQVNYLAHVLLTEKLLPLVKRKQKARILNISSMIHANSLPLDNLQGEKKFLASEQYALTKLLNIMHAYYLSEVLKNDEISVHAVHPGVIDTKLLNKAFKGGFPVEEGADTLLYCCESQAIEGMTGLYLENRRPMQSASISYDTDLQKELQKIAIEMLKTADVL